MVEGIRKSKESDYIFVEQNYLKMKDDEMAQVLGCSVPNIRRIRKKLGAKKNKSNLKNVKTIKSPATRIAEESGDIVSIGLLNDLDVTSLSEEQTKALFTKIFKNSTQYEMLKRQYDEEEFKYYIEKFITFLSDVKMQGEELSSVETENINELIHLLIAQARYNVRQREVERDLKELPRSSYRDKTDDDKFLVSIYENRLKETTKSLKDTNEMIIKIQESLSMTRSERQKRQSSATEGVFKIIKAMQDEKERNKIDVHAAMLKKATEKVGKKMEEEGLVSVCKEEQREETVIDAGDATNVSNA
jgi:hypothetical protein